MKDKLSGKMSKIGIETVKSLAKQSLAEDKLQELLGFIKDKDPILARNAAWVLTHFSNEQIKSLQPLQNEFIDLIIKTDNSSLRRLLMNVVDRQEILEENLRTDFLDFCLEHAILKTEQPGIQSLCIKLAYKQCLFYPELLREFKDTLLLMEMDYAKCVQSLIKRYLKLLKI